MRACPPIAIIGMAGRMPQADSLEDFWNNLQSGKDSITEIPPDRWDWRAFYGESGSNKTKVKWGGFLSDVDKFDARFFGIPPKEAEYMDPQHRVFLETAWSTIEDAGYRVSDLSGKNISVFVGISTQDYRKRLDHPDADMDARISTGMAVSMLANRISYLFNFSGPSDISDTACSSALVAIHRGIQSIRDEGCEMALVGGVNLILIPDGMVAFGKAGMLSEEKDVSAFDKKAQGYARGEGVGAILLKPLSQALKDGDSIHAILRGSAINHSGRSYSLTAPDLKGQTQVIVEAYRQAGLTPNTVNYLEAHGTGTQVGDNIEVRAFKKAFAHMAHGNAEQTCKIGALKPNIGHLEAASGVAALFKVVLAMKHQTKLGVKNFKKLNPLIKFSGSPFYINNAHEVWEPLTNDQGEELPRRASLHSFGFSGVNAHLILEEPPVLSPLESEEKSKGALPPHLIVLSAKNESCLHQMVDNLIRFIEQPVPLANLAHTLQVGREEMEVRFVTVVQNLAQLREKLTRWKQGEHEECEALHHQVQQWLAGKSLDGWNPYEPGSVQRLLGVPGYPFEKTSHWLPDLHSKNAPRVEEFSVNEPAVQLLEGTERTQFLKKILHEVSGLPLEELTEEETFFELGFDSLLLAEYKNRLASYFPVSFSLESLLEHDSLEKLSSYLDSHLGANFTVDFSDHHPLQLPPMAPLLDTYPLAKEQMRYWRTHQLAKAMDSGKSLSIPLSLTLGRKIDGSLFKKALSLLVRRQEALRTHFVETPEGVQQHIVEHLELPFSIIEDSAGGKSQVPGLIEGLVQTQWDLENGPLWKMILIQQTNQTLLLLSFHHIIADLWSVQIFLHELSELYRAWEHKTPNPLPVPSHRYVDFAHHQAMKPSIEENHPPQSYWQNLLATPWEELELPFRKNKKRQLKNKATQIAVPLEASETQQIQKFCKTHHTTPSTFFLSALNLLLFGWTEQKRLIIGTPLQNRESSVWEPLIGCFANVSFSVLDVEENQTVLSLMEQVQNNIVSMRQHALSFSEITTHLQKARRDPLCPVVQVMFNTMKSSKALAALFETESQLHPLPRPFLDFDMALTVIEEEHGSGLHFEYAENLFGPETMERFCEQYKTLLSWMLHAPQTPVHGVFDQAELTRRKCIGIAATFTAEPITASLQHWMNETGQASRVAFAAFNQVFQELLDPTSLLRQNRRGVNVLLIRLSDWLQNNDDLEKTVSEWVDALEAAVNASQTPYLVLLCPTLMENEERHRVWLEQAERKLCTSLEPLQRVTVWHSEQIQQVYPVEPIFDPLLDQIGSLPYSEPYFNALGTTIARHCFGQWNSFLKVLVVDGDQTLWEGIVGEDGVEGIVLGESRALFQRKLKALKNSGILLCLCSKNTEADIEAVFAKRNDFVLSKEDFVCIKASWEVKSQAVISIANELNLGLDSFIFIDDNPLEIAEVQAQCPQVLCLQFPTTATEIESFVQHNWFLDEHGQTQEDQKRTRWYQQSLERDQLKASTPSYADFIDKLALQIKIKPITSPQIERVAQLTQRTNQFNSTTIRRSEQEIRELMDQKTFHIERVEVVDRFGDYGLVGVVVFQQTEEKTTVESLILSCRVLGRGVEHAMLCKVGQLALQKGHSRIEIQFRPSPRNAPVANFLKSLEELSPEQDGLCFSTNAQQLANLHFRPQSSFPPEAPSQSKGAGSHPSNSSFPRKGAEWVEQWMTFSDMDRLSEKALQKQRRPGLDAFQPPQTQTEKDLASIWQDILKIEAVGAEHSFFELGGTSIELVQVLAKTRERFGIPLPLQVFSENSTVRGIAKEIKSYQETGEFLQSHDQSFPDLLKDSVLPPTIQGQIARLLDGGRPLAQNQEQPKVLLTGATGFLGAYLLSTLLEKTSFVICCLVRAEDQPSGWQRIQKNMAAYNLPCDAQRIEVVLGDLAQPHLGMTAETYERLSRDICEVFHNGALVNFVIPYETLKPVNVDGTQTCLEFACTGRLKRFHYVSTASVFDSQFFHSVENAKEENLNQDSFQVYGGYAQSKWAAEQLVLSAGEQGMAVTVFRPNGIGPSMDPNHTRFNIDDAFSLVILASLSIRKFFDLSLHVDFAPVDYVASAIVVLSRKSETTQIYALTNPVPQTLPKVQQELKKLGEEVQLLPYAEWASEIEHYANTVENRKLQALLPLLKEPMAARGESWFELTTHRPQFDCQNTLQGLKGSSVACPAVDSDSVMKLLLLSFLTNNYLESTQAIKPQQSQRERSKEPLGKSESKQKRGIILSWSLGSGHNASAQAIAHFMEEQEEVVFETVDLGDWVSYVRSLENFWSHLSRNNIYQLEAYTEVTQACQQHETAQFQQIYQTTAQQLQSHYQPDMVVSVCPLGCQLLRYFKEIVPALDTVTYVSDWFGGKYKEWGDAGADWIYSPSQECSQFLRETCLAEEPEIEAKIVTGSLIMRSGFTSTFSGTSSKEMRQTRGVGEHEPLLLFNTYGNAVSLQFLKNLPERYASLHVMVMCYNNESILEEVEALKSDFPGTLEGQLWFDDMEDWLQISDVLFTKPGPGICAEALMCNTALLLDASQGIMPQEISVYEKLLADGLGVGIKAKTDFEQALQSWGDSDPQHQAMLNNVQNHTMEDGCQDFCHRVLERTGSFETLI